MMSRNESNDRIQFKIIHLKSKKNREKNFDATKELRDLTKNNDTTTSGSKKKRVRTTFGTGSKSTEKHDSGSRAKPKFLLGE